MNADSRLKNILVTGGAGFIGSHLVDDLVKIGHAVTVIDNLSSGKISNLPKECHLEIGDIRDSVCVDRCVEGKDVVFHLAAFTSVPESIEQPELCNEINVLGSKTVLNSVRKAGVERLVFASTSAVYADYSSIPWKESSQPLPQSPYAESKLEMEYSLESSFHESGLGYAALRFFNVYGPRQDAASDYASVIPRFILNGQSNKTLTVYGNGRQTRDFVYVADVARALISAMNSTENGIFNVGTSQATSILDLAKHLLELVGTASGYEFSDTRSGDAMSSTADLYHTSKILGWFPQWELADGLRETVMWFKQQKRSAPKFEQSQR